MNVNQRILRTAVQQSGDAPFAVRPYANEAPVTLRVDSPSPGLLALESGWQVRVDLIHNSRTRRVRRNGAK